jgi:two-component system, NtrC family, response regulator HydG
LTSATMEPRAPREDDSTPPKAAEESKGSVLIVDDERTILSSLQRVFTSRRYQVATLDAPHAVLDLLAQQHVDVILVDLRMPHMSGLELLELVKSKRPDIEVVVMTAHATVDTALAAVRAGAFDYLMKPFDTIERVVHTVEKAVERARLVDRTRRLERELEAATATAFPTIVGQSPKMAEIFRLVDHVAKSSANVLIQGETGTGKELVARAIHDRSDRAKRPMVTINCSALTESLLESELFGHTKGSFTGALANKKGLFEAADGGTIFLDEVGDMSPATQVKVLRVLQDGEVRPIGSTTIVRTDVRVIAATNVDLLKAMKNGAFREDLYWRLNVINVGIPPLRERASDIPVLATHFLRQYAEKMRRDVQTISDEAMAVLVAHRWDGNVRELENVVERAVVLCRGTSIGARDLPDHVAPRARADHEPAQLVNMPFREAKDSTISAFERRYAEALLRRTKGNISECARLSELDRSNFRRLLHKHSLDAGAFRDGE